MSTLEKLFVQLFEQKKRLLEQVQQQADSYTQQLASTLLIDGMTPPSWLLSPNSSNSKELEKEEIMSKLLFQPTRDPVAYSRGKCSLYSQPVFAGNDGRFLKETCVKTNAPDKGLHVTDELMKTLECENIETLECENNETFECPDKDEGCSLSCAAEKDDGIISPLNETDARISSIYSAPDMSLVRIQRSRSRQKALELRTSGKATGKSCLGNENRTAMSSSGDLKSDFQHVSQDNHQSEADKCIGMSGANSIAAEGKAEKGNDRGSQSSRLAKSSSPNERPSYANDASKNSPSHEKNELDGDNQVQSIGNISQPGHTDAVIKEGKHSEVCLGSNASSKSINVKTNDSQRHNEGRITRSRSSFQQPSGIDKSSNLGTSDSCIPKEYGSSVPQIVSNLTDGLNDSSKLSNAVEASQVLSDKIGETISSNEGALKQIDSSNIVGARVTGSRSGPMNESQLAANHQNSAHVVVENGPTEAPIVLQPVSSGMKLDVVPTVSEGLASMQSPDCSVGVKPIQLNFDEIDECNLDEVCSPLSKKRRLDGLPSDECYPLKESASSVDYESSSKLFEQQLPETNVLSNSAIHAMTPFHNDIECGKDETLNISLDENKKPMVEAVEHNSKVTVFDNIDVTCEMDTSPKEVHNILNEEKHSEKSHYSEDRGSLPEMQIEEGDLGHKGEGSVAGDANSSFVSNSTKQGNKDSQHCLDNEVRIPDNDLGSLITEESDGGTILKLSNVKLNSVKFNTWPEKHQRYIEDQPNCFSDVKGYRVHIQKDAVHFNLDANENDSYSVREYASICDRSVRDDLMCDLPEETESLQKLQAVKVNATELGDVTTEITHTPKHSEPTMAISNLISNAGGDLNNSLVEDMEPTHLSSIDDVNTDNKYSEISFSEWASSFASFRFSQTDEKSLNVSDEIMPSYERFIIDQNVENASMENAESGIDFHAMEIASTTIERASIIEKLCKSATMDTPLSQFSSKHMQPQLQDMYEFMADGTIDQMDFGSVVSFDQDSKNHLQTSEISGPSENQQQFESVPLTASPYYWQSKSHFLSPVGKFWERSASSSGGSGSSGKQLSSNPELTCFPIEEDPRSDEENDDDMADEKEPIPEATEISSQHVNPVSVSKKHPDRCSSNSVNIEHSVPRTRDNVKYKPKNCLGIKTSRYGEVNRTPSMATRASSRGNVSGYSNKSSLRNRIPRVSQKEVKSNNIVSNITSFIPIVQQKQAAAVCPGKRDIKVKALEAAEAAKRREQEKENERKMKKEALKLERARIGKENAREIELEKKRKQDAWKRKEADIAARKRQREEEEKKQVAKKRKLVAEAQKNQKLQFEKSRFGKVELEKQQSKNAAIAGNKKAFENPRQMKNADENSSQTHNAELKTARVIQQVTSVAETRDASVGCGEKEKATRVSENTPVKVDPVKSTTQENSYEISPYFSDDDEDDEEDDLPKTKFVPSWASKSRVAMVLPLQQSLNPETIFHVESFCSIDEVLLPLRLQQ
ncbi:uncharacterized protein [Rutidosis leptorrhynchoides]|uniref:uncharacterized protein n=1 Tax=Rutidosis leptorrhynchoides TaxID=125765 RepID=UPI003A99EA81